MKKPNLIVIAGPTAVGKTSVSIEIAKHFSAEIISADSRQLYRELEIGTAVPSLEELKQVKHHFIQSNSIDHPVSAGEYEKLAISKIEQLFLKHNTLILTGGSGLFIDAVTKGIDDSFPSAEPKIREELESMLESNGIQWLQQKLKELDENYYKKVDLNNPRRLIRALEICLSTKKPYSSLLKNKSKIRSFNCIKICLNIDRVDLYERINNRVDSMLSLGLLEEVKSLYPKKHLVSLKTVGYSELFDFLEGKLKLEEAIELIKRNSRRYAKRQITWFKRDSNYLWLNPNNIENIIKEIDLQQN